MKKTISLLLAALLALSAITVSMASCERNNPADTTADDTPKELTPKEIYEAAVKKFDEANNYAVTYNHSNRLREGKENFGRPTSMRMLRNTVTGTMYIAIFLKTVRRQSFPIVTG